jgi:hypothetical protein
MPSRPSTTRQSNGFSLSIDEDYAGPWPRPSLNAWPPRTQVDCSAATQTGRPPALPPMTISLGRRSIQGFLALAVAACNAKRRPPASRLERASDEERVP